MDEELLSEFLTESNENLAEIEQQLMDLENDPQNEELLAAIFRTIHTVKGSCGFIGLSKLEKVAHAGENLLSRIRATHFAVTEDIVSLLLENADAIKGILEHLEREGCEPDVDHSQLINRLQAAERLVAAMAEQGEGVAPPPKEEPAAQEGGDGGAGPDPATILAGWAADYSQELRDCLAAAGLATPQQIVDAGFAKLKELDAFTPADALKLLGTAKAAVAAGNADGAIAEPPPEEKKEPKSAPKAEAQPAAADSGAAEVKQGEITQPKQAAKAPSAPAPAKKPAAKAGPPAAQPQRKPAGAGSVRVDVELLDELMNQVGELVLTRNRLMQMVTTMGSMELMRVGRDVDQITEQLQEKLLRTRMQSIQSIWSSVPRIVRDIGKQLEKKIKVVMHGEETELDRTILNALKDPLTHIIRNSCDHGIELPAVRRELGKPEEGTLTLSAKQESGFILINIQDDGAGIDPQKIKNKAVAMGVITEEQAAAMPDKAALQLIFNPGLSTAEKVSNISGRGVGMDVVKTSIEKVGGTTEIMSEVGRGTTLRIRIPLTLAIISAMIVGVRGHRLAVPQMSVQELLNAPEESEDWRLIAGRPFFRLRGKLLPILRLSDCLKLPERRRKRKEGEEVKIDPMQDQRQVNAGSIVVVDVGDQPFGVLVDEIIGAEEIVVKPLGVHFEHLKLYGGCSILGDGRVVPILDCNGLAGMLQKTEEHDVTAYAMEEEGARFGQEALQHTLIYKQGDQRYAIPMALVERLENFPADRIERSSKGEVLQYRGAVIPVLRWGDLVGAPSVDGEDIYCLILSDGHKRMALQVEDVIDILEIPLDIKMASDSPLFLGTAVIQDLATEVVDVFEVVKQVDPNWFQRNKREEAEVKLKVLYAEAAPFFRNLVVPVLETLNLEIWQASDGAEAVRILEERTPDLILTDIEMPNMDGYELATWVREHPHLAEIPIVALTATPPDEDDEARRSLFTEILLKFDRQSIEEFLREHLDNIGVRGEFDSL
ncbi:MAG: hybrid sensor histidine kinase/response regulator [Zetaproteobacteria bacterium]|nr:MAG: hybrid sensor histidine kinase/response regulator [Zetaproteobacteria bacterium]